MVVKDAIHYTIYMKLDDIAELLCQNNFVPTVKSYH